MCAGPSASAASQIGAAPPASVCPGSRVHQVEIEIVEAGARAAPRRRVAMSLRRSGCARAVCSCRRVEALRAERDAVDAGGAIVGEAAALDRAGVRFQRDLGVRRERAAARAHASSKRADRLAARTGSACRRRRTPRRARGLRTPAACDREILEQRVDVLLLRKSLAAAACELKSQYGHLRTHQGMCTYSASGGDGSCTGRCRRSQLRDQPAQRLAAMAQLVLLRGGSSRRRCASRRRQLEDRVVAEAAAAARRVDDACLPSCLRRSADADRRARA